MSIRTDGAVDRQDKGSDRTLHRVKYVLHGPTPPITVPSSPSLQILRFRNGVKLVVISSTDEIRDGGEGESPSSSAEPSKVRCHNCHERDEIVDLHLWMTDSTLLRFRRFYR